jgi:hypothetical protein
VERLVARYIGFDDVHHVELHFRWPTSVKPTYHVLTPSWWNWVESIAFGCRGAVTVDTSVEREIICDRVLGAKRDGQRRYKGMDCGCVEV